MGYSIGAGTHSSSVGASKCAGPKQDLSTPSLWAPSLQSGRFPTNHHTAAEAHQPVFLISDTHITAHMNTDTHPHKHTSTQVHALLICFWLTMLPTRTID